MQLLRSAASFWSHGDNKSQNSHLPQSSEAMFQEKTSEEIENKEQNDSDIDMEETIQTFDCLEDEIEYLRQQNFKLKEKLKETKSIVQSPEELSYRVQERLPDFIKKADFEAHPNVVFIPSEIDGEVGLIDKTSIDWWSVVDLTNPCENGLSPLSTENANKPSDELIFPDAQGLEGPYVSIKESDVIDSIAYFVAQCVVTMPECRNLTHEQMLKKLDTTFAELREKQFFHRMYDWTMFLYSGYGWSQYAWSVYQNPWMAQMVSSCFWKAAWLIVL